MTNSQRSAMLAELSLAKDVCDRTAALDGLAEQLVPAIDALLLLVAGNRRCQRNDVIHQTTQPRRSDLDGLRRAEEHVRAAYAMFETEVSENRPLTYGDKVVFQLVDDAIWTIGGLWDWLNAIHDGEEDGD